MQESSSFFSPFSGDAADAPELELLNAREEGFSVLYMFSRDGRRRILKALKPEYRGNHAYESLLRKEYDLGIQMDHPNIRQFYSFTSHPALGSCIEMEWIDGRTLESLLQEGPLSRSAARRIISQLCSALSYLHSRQAVHRDLKPANILITGKGGDVKLIDFGLSDSDGFYLHKEPAGTPHYAAPELKAGENCDQRCDIYSLGKILSEMSPAFRRIARRCTAENPARRYSDTSQVAAAIRRTHVLRILLPCAALLAAALLTLFLLSGHNSTPPDRIVREAEKVIRSAGW